VYLEVYYLVPNSVPQYYFHRISRKEGWGEGSELNTQYCQKEKKVQEWRN
jgi:hypothetical protein